MALMRQVATAISNLVNRALEGERRQQVEDLLKLSAQWQPTPTNFTFREEMQNRISYFHGSMQKDMNDELKRRFPQTYKDIWEDQVNLSILRKQTKDKAKVFLSTGQMYLIDEEGNRDNGDDQDRFQKLLDASRFYSNCKQCDEYTQLCARALFKPWWDVQQKKIRISIWPQHLVHVVPDPDRWWDVDAAYAVLLELPGYNGLIAMNPRYEVWGKRDPAAAAVTQQNTVHYTTDGEKDTQVNKEDVNPFTWENKPIYPFVWWQSDETTDLYSIGAEDALTVNRRVNSLLTDMVQAIHYKAWGLWVHTMAEGGSELGVKVIAPNKVVDIPYGASLENVAPDLPLRETKEVADMLIKDSCMLEGLASSVLRTEHAAPESGYSLEIRNKPLKEHRENMIEIYRPFVLESAKRTAIVWNTYNPGEKIDLSKFKIHWEPGDMQIPTNPDEEGNQFALEITHNVSSAVDWYMKKTGVDRKTAKKEIAKRLLENERFTKKENKEMPPNMDNRLKEGDEKPPPFEKKEEPEPTEE
jgi:hypothetical protein